MWTILIAELKYQRHVAVTIYLLVALMASGAAALGLLDAGVRRGHNAAYLMLFVMFLGYVFTLILEPISREQRDRLIAALPVPVWQGALALRLVLLTHWCGYCLLFVVVCFFAPAVYHWTPQTGIALAAQSGLVLIVTAVGELHFDHAWPDFRRRQGAGMSKVLAAVLLGMLWLEIYLLSFVQLLGLVDCFRQHTGTLLSQLYLAPANAVMLLLAGLGLQLALAAAKSRRRSSVRG